MIENNQIIGNNEDITNIMSDKEILAQNIAFFRKKMNMSQTELAKKLQYSNKNISKWELAETTPDIFTIKKLAQIFNISIDTLLTPISSENKKAIKTKVAVPFRWKMYMLFMVNAILILCGCITFFVLKLLDITSFKIEYIFVYILPLICLAIFIFICCTKKKVDIISLSLLGWLIVLCFYLSFIKYQNINYVFLIGFGWQILAPIVATLINSGKLIKFNKMLIKKMKNKKD